MKKNLVDFTRGSQLLGHFSFMFAAGLKGPLIIAALIISWMSWWMLSTGLSDHESYLVGMKFYAAAYGFMEFDPNKEIALETAFGGTVKFPIVYVEAFPPVARAWDHMVSILGRALTYSALLLVPAFALFYWFASRFGAKSKERKHERGAMLSTLPELVEEVRVHNNAEKAKELTAVLGWRYRLCSQKELAEVFPYRPSRLAKVTYPWRLEQSHAMLIGTTGMGKTVALSEMIEEARARGQRAVIFDLTGAFIEHFFDSSRDVILNPLDARCPMWSVFDECRDEAEFTAAAEALVPHDGGGAEQFWVLAARLLFVEMCLKLRARGQATNEALAAELMTADLAAVHRLMRGTIADPLTAPEAARMAESIRAVFNANAKALTLLPKTGKQFSVRDWIESDKRDGSMVFISARYVDMSVCSQLLTVWLDLAMNTLMAMDRTREVRMWFFVDELGALHRLPALEKGLQTARNFGGAIVTGIHAYAKLKEVYGENMAMTLSSLARTKLILGTADRATATWCSDFIGHRQVRDMEEGYTYGYNNARDAVSLTSRKHIEPLLLPDQLMNLPRLSGYLKFPDGFPAAPVKLVPVDRVRHADPFIRRAEDSGSKAGPASPHSPPSGPSPVPPAPAPAPQANGGNDPAAPHAANDDGAGQRIVPRQGELALRSGQEASISGGEAEQREPIAEVLKEARATEFASTVPAPSALDAAHAAGPREGQAPLALPKEAALRLVSGDGQEQGRSKDGQDPPRSDAPQVLKADSEQKPEAKQGVLGAAAEARKLMLEDGLAEHDEPGRDARGLGEADMEI
ncbi:type IV secretion system DNA-binding domain-containing protein [Sphingorhabdus sp.]|uniref:type IV secretion system DNA-binding domain-containing protein n=1 Tax=Sphingorhabdus sp. TaxID=1902408 RepID=UPI0032B84ACB